MNDTAKKNTGHNPNRSAANAAATDDGPDNWPDDAAGDRT
jgi:hypothetical protein